jgi:hypothetical protein
MSVAVVSSAACIPTSWPTWPVRREVRLGAGGGETTVGRGSWGEFMLAAKLRFSFESILFCSVLLLLESRGRQCFVFLMAPRGVLCTGSTGRHDLKRIREGEGESGAEGDQGGEDGRENDD